MYVCILPPAVVAPVFSAPPLSPPDVLALQGTTITIPCRARGFPPPTFSWSRQLGGGSRQTVQFDERHSIPEPGMGDGTLTISPVMISDTTILACVASNSPNSPAVESDFVLLRVIGQPHPLLYVECDMRYISPYSNAYHIAPPPCLGSASPWDPCDPPMLRPTLGR